MTYFDIHAHLNFSAYDNDRDAVIARTKKDGVYVINVGTQYEMSQKAVELAKNHNNMWAIVGLHPVHTCSSFHDSKELGEGGKEFTSRGEVFDYDAYKTLAVLDRVVGIGECGLDYYHAETENFEKQKEVFRSQLELARDVKKPVMLHVRTHDGDSDGAYRDVFSILREFPDVKGNVHFFAGTLDTARQFLDRGFTLSFTGVITFTHQYDELVSYVPLDRIVSETDSPFVAPLSYRGKRNEPSYVSFVVEAIARIKKCTSQNVQENIARTVKSVWNIGSDNS